MFLVEHWNWYSHFSQNYWYHTPTDIIAMFALMVWLVPLGFFVSLSVDDTTLPVSGKRVGCIPHTMQMFSHISIYLSAFVTCALFDSGAEAATVASAPLKRSFNFKSIINFFRNSGPKLPTNVSDAENASSDMPDSSSPYSSSSSSSAYASSYGSVSAVPSSASSLSGAAVADDGFAMLRPTSSQFSRASSASYSSPSATSSAAAAAAATEIVHDYSPSSSSASATSAAVMPGSVPSAASASIHQPSSLGLRASGFAARAPVAPGKAD
jgi:hypothetical protein